MLVRARRCVTLSTIPPPPSPVPSLHTRTQCYLPQHMHAGRGACAWDFLKRPLTLFFVLTPFFSFCKSYSTIDKINTFSSVGFCYHNERSHDT